MTKLKLSKFSHWKHVDISICLKGKDSKSKFAWQTICSRGDNKIICEQKFSLSPSPYLLGFHGQTTVHVTKFIMVALWHCWYISTSSRVWPAPLQLCEYSKVQSQLSPQIQSVLCVIRCITQEELKLRVTKQPVSIAVVITVSGVQ